MNFRTDLALEMRESVPQAEIDGISSEEITIGKVKVTRIKVLNERGGQVIEKKPGDYITVEVPPFSGNAEEFDERLTVLSKEISNLLPNDGLILVAGLGNETITPDALGPKVAEKILATRHIAGEVASAIGLDGLRSVAAIAPGVLGQTGIETGELIAGVCDKVKPAAVIVIDALASRQLSRLGRTVQITDTGISPGSGVNNRRMEISGETLGVPVVAIGVPTIVDAATLAADLVEKSTGSSEQGDSLRRVVEPDGAAMMVTPREIDLLIDRAASLISLSINSCLHKNLSPEDIISLVS